MSSTAINQELLAAAVRSIPPGDLGSMRQRAVEKFATTGFPTAKDEDWKYTNLGAAAELSNNWLRSFDGAAVNDSSPTTDVAAIVRLTEAVDADWIVIRNGIVDSATLAAAVAATKGDITISHLQNDSVIDQLDVGDPMSAFNAALLRDGLHIRAGKNTQREKPIGLIYVDDSAEEVSLARVVVECADNSRLKIVEYAYSEGAAKFSSVVTQVNMATGARLDYARIQERDPAHVGVNRLKATLAKDALLNHSAFDLGSALARNDIVVEITGAGVEANLHGLYLTSEKQHVDNHLRMIHCVGPSLSMQNYRGILSGHSRCVFNGKAEVLKGADGTDANQRNHNLLLSDRAEIDTKPELEIYADDVKCSHGATVGQLDESAIFYLRTRGLSEENAKLLLTRAFVAEILDALTIDECRGYLSESVQRRLDQLIDGGAQ
jgi:Fe-S cluster assembly protein SufD